MLKNLYSKSESISLELFNKKETNDFVIKSLSNSINETQLNRIIESFNLKYENIRPYALNKIIASIKLKIDNNLSIKMDDLFDYEKDALFDDLIQDKNNWQFLQICSFFNPDYIPYDTFKSILKTEQIVFNSIERLNKISIIQIQRGLTNGIKMHIILKEEIKAYSKEKDTENYYKLLDNCSEKIQKLPFDSEYTELKKQKLHTNNAYLNLKCFLKTMTEIKLNRTELQKWYDYFSVYSKNLNNINDTLEFKNVELNILLEILPQNHTKIARSYNNIGMIHLNKGENNKALEYYLKSLDIQLLSLPPDNRIIATIYNNIGGVYKYNGENEQALEYYIKSLELYILSLPSNHPNIATSYNNVGGVYYDKGENEKALEYYLRTMAPRFRPALFASHRYRAPDTILQ